MPELKITAVDTSLAMDEVEKKLGPDALILSTTRRDGMIEILATNEPDQIDAANLKAKEKAKARLENRLLSEEQIDAANLKAKEKAKARQESSISELPYSKNTEKFSELVDAEVSKYENKSDSQEPIGSNEPNPSALGDNRSEKSDLAMAFEQKLSELQFLVDGTIALSQQSNTSLSINAKMKMLGFSNKTATTLIDKNEPNLELHDLMRQFTRQIVQGKSKDFDASQIILVCGAERSGKTLLSKKLAKFLPTHTAAQNSTLILQNNRVIADPLSGDLNSLFKSSSDANVTSLFRKRQDIALDGSRLIVDYEGPMDLLNSVLMRLETLEHKPQVSVIYTLEVGKSYDAVRQALEVLQIPNLSVALTKMDLLEVSISELSAVFDLGRKIQFFSGLKTLEDGLDFAKISVVEDFLLDIVRQDGL
jgi:flagellar biosynthesis protein FlhF